MTTKRTLVLVIVAIVRLTNSFPFYQNEDRTYEDHHTHLYQNQDEDGYKTSRHGFNDFGNIEHSASLLEKNNKYVDLNENADSSSDSPDDHTSTIDDNHNENLGSNEVINSYETFKKHLDADYENPFNNPIYENNQDLYYSESGDNERSKHDDGDQDQKDDYYRKERPGERWIKHIKEYGPMLLSIAKFLIG